MRISYSTLGAAFIVIGLAAPALAAPPAAESKRAAQSFAVGKTAYARGDFAGAAAAFEQAAFYSPHPAPLLNAAEAWELAGNFVRSAQLCDRVLEGEDVDAKFRQAAQQQLSRVSPRITTVDVKTPEGARLGVQGERDETTGHRLRLTPGAHTVVVTYKTGETRSETVSLSAGASKELDMTSPPPPKEAPPPEPPPVLETHSGPPVGTWISFGLAAASGGAAAFFGVRTLDAQKNFDANPTEQTRDEFNSARLLTNVFIGVAVVSAAVGVVLWVASPTSSEASKKATDASMGIVRF